MLKEAIRDSVIVNSIEYDDIDLDDVYDQGIYLADGNGKISYVSVSEIVLSSIIKQFMTGGK